MNQLLGKFYALNYLEYPTYDEETDLIKYAKTINFRINALKEIEKKEEKIIDETFDYMMDKFPSMSKFPAYTPKSKRDLKIILRYCGHAMLRDDVDFLNDQLLFWLKTIIHSFGFEDGVIRDTLVKMDDLCKRDIDPKVYNFLNPYLKNTINVLS